MIKFPPSPIKLLTLLTVIFLGTYISLFLLSLENANLTGEDLRGARLDHALNVTCEQIQSAVIDQNTHLPGYIILTGNPEGNYQCKNIKKE